MCAMCVCVVCVSVFMGMMCGWGYDYVCVIVCMPVFVYECVYLCVVVG